MIWVVLTLGQSDPHFYRHQESVQSVSFLPCVQLAIQFSKRKTIIIMCNGPHCRKRMRGHDKLFGKIKLLCLRRFCCLFKSYMKQWMINPKRLYRSSGVGLVVRMTVSSIAKVPKDDYHPQRNSHQRMYRMIIS